MITSQKNVHRTYRVYFCLVFQSFDTVQISHPQQANLQDKVHNGNITCRNVHSDWCEVNSPFSLKLKDLMLKLDNINK